MGKATWYALSTSSVMRGVVSGPRRAFCNQKKVASVGQLLDLPRSSAIDLPAGVPNHGHHSTFEVGLS